MQNKYAALKAQLLEIIEGAEDEFDLTDEDDASDASAEFAYVLEQIAQAYAAAGFDVVHIVEDSI
jgi:citrate lyase beta subunit